MIRKLTVIQTLNTDPYHNLALEEYSLRKVHDDELILYLWQNRNTVVIGKNQNASVECKVNRLREDGGHLTRRLSGGGAVYHDLGNLNFTFIMHKRDFDKARQTDVILNAARRLGINCEKTGRNDIVADGRKFSGHSYYSSGDRAFHNGTLMIDVDKEILSHYLNVSPLKLKSKGVKSVRSRVVNMRELNPAITLVDVSRALIEACQKEYSVKAGFILDSEDMPLLIDDKVVFGEILNKFKSDEWIYGREIPMEYSCEEKFEWGIVRIDLDIEDNRITRSAVWSDSIDGEEMSSVPDALEGINADRVSILTALKNVLAEEEAIDMTDLIMNNIRVDR